MNKILITGGAGFIGNHIAHKLSEEKNNQITILDNLQRGKMDDEFKRLIDKENVQFIQADLTDNLFYEKLDDGYDEVYHLAAIVGVKNVEENPHKVLEINSKSVMNLLEWFVESDSKKILFSSSSEVYAWTSTFHDINIPTPEDVPLSVDDPANKRATYALSKIFGEMAIINYCRDSDKDYSIVRYHNIYGPRMGMAHVIPELIKKTLSDEDNLEVFSVDNTRAFCYIKDAVRATIEVMRANSTNGEILNIGNNKEEIKIGKLAEKIIDTVGEDKNIKPVELESDKISRRCPDISKLRKLCDYEPQYPLDEGLERTYEWYKDKV